MSDEIVIRTSRRDDFKQLLALDNEIWNDSTSPGIFQRSSIAEYEKRNPPGSQLVAVDGKNLCGYLGFHPPTELASNEHVSEINIAVHPTYQKRGIGRRLVNATIDMLSEKGIKKLSLRVLSTNKPAITFYMKCGFKEQGRLVREFKLNGRYIDDVLMYLLVNEKNGGYAELPR